MADHSDWPPSFKAALETPPVERRGWQRSLAPQLIGLFLWIAYFDQIPREVLGTGGMAWPVLGAALAGLLCYLLLYRTPALWGMTTGRPLSVVATSTFGVNGATWVPGLLLAGAGVVWLAVATHESTALSLRGMVLVGLLDPKYLQAARGTIPGFLFLVTSFLWCLSAALVGRYLVRVIAALMNVFAILPAMILAVTTILAFKGLRGYHAAETLSLASSDVFRAGTVAALITVQFIFSFFATAGLSAADWGTVAPDARDVRSGGWVGVAFASWIVATLAILTTAGAQTRGVRGAATVALSYHEALETLVRGRTAGALLLILGLSALAPACYAAHIFSLRLNETWHRPGRTTWTVLGVASAWLLVAIGWVDRLFDVFSLIGGLVAPAVGALSADYVKSRGVWPGPRRGENLPGLVAWALGSLVGIAPLLGRLADIPRLASIEPAAVLGFLAAFASYLILATLGMESARDDRFDDVQQTIP